MKVPKDKNNVTKEKKEKEKKPGTAHEEHYVIKPPNGGWGWLVVLSALYCNIVADGIQLTFGIFLNPISKSFNAAFSEVSLAGSLMFGSHLLMGPLCAGCNSAFGLRPVTIIGSLICCFGVGISYFSNGYIFLCCSFGIIGGVGLGLVYMNTLVITSLYFTTMLPVAVGIVVCGTGIGTMIFAGLGSVLLKITTWQNSFLMQAALAGTMGLAATVFRPLKPVKVMITPSPSRDKIPGPSSTTKNTVSVKADRGSISSIVTLQDVAWNLARKMTVDDDDGVKKKQKCGCSRCCRRKKKPPVTEIEKKNADTRPKSNTQKTDDRNPKKVKKKSAKERIWFPIKQTVKTMLDCSLLGSFPFFLFTLSGAIQIAALLIVFIYEKDRTQNLGYAEDVSVIFLIALGGTNVFWRLFWGLLAAFVKINYKWLLIIGITIGGVATLCSGFTSNIYFEFVFCLFFSLAMAVGAVFRVVLLVELVGIERIATATGINLLFMGVFCIVSPPLFGLIMEATKSYQILFSITGGLIILSGLMLIGVKKVELKEKKSKNKQATKR